MNDSFRRFLLPAIFSIFQSLLILSAQESKSWEITADPGTPYLTTIVPIESGHRSIPFLSRVERIWDESLSGLPYNAFGDIIRFRDNWYCTFREGEIHQNHESGRVRIIRSSDGEAWETVALFESDGGDVRDAKFSITADSQLMVNSSIYFMSPDAPFGRRSVTWLSSDGENWSNIYECNSGINTWRWSVTWHKGVGYSIGYSGKDISGTLYTTRDGKIWDVLINNFFPGGRGNEASLAFDHDDKAFCLLRDGPGGMAQLGVAKPPYSEWSWSDLGMYGGGPEMIRLKDGRFLAVLRLHEGGLPASDIMPGNFPDRGGRTSLLWIDPQNGIMKEFLTLPSGGRGGHSYAGAFEYDGMIWISYYSSHENVTKESRPAIYLAKVKLAPGINTSCNTPVKGIDGNIYKTIRIGNQEWMAENLNVSHFRNGDPIPEARNEEWTRTGREGKPAWCTLDHKPENANIYGKLYNWYAVADPRGLCPDGWRIPDDENWRQLIGFLGGEQVAGDKMKSLTGWEDGGKGTNESGFSALPGGFRLHRANRFDSSGGYWWGSEQGFVYISGNYPLYYSKGGGHRYFTSKARGLSVRCIRENVRENISVHPSTTKPAFQVDYASPTADKPQSKLWYMEGYWWALLPRASGPSLWQRTEKGWKEHIYISEQLKGLSGRSDVWADDKQVIAAGVNYVKKPNYSISVFQLSRKDGSSEIHWETSILAELLPPSPGDAIETATIIRDSKGRLWVAAVAGSKVCVWSSSSGGKKWTPPFVLAQGIDNDDICVITPLPDNEIGVIWSDQIREAIVMRKHLDARSAKLWEQEEIIEMGNNAADDHLNTSLSPNGTLWLATKNSVDMVGKPQFVLRVRSRNGNWTNLPYVVKGKMQWQSRPIVIATEDNSIVLSGYGGNDRAVPSLYNPVIISGVIDTCSAAILVNPQVVISPDSIYSKSVQNITGPRHPFPTGVPWIVLASDLEGYVYEADLSDYFLKP